MTTIVPCMLATALGLAGVAPAQPEPSKPSGTATEGDMFFPVRVVVDVTELPGAGQPAEVSDKTGTRLTEELTESLRDEYRLRVVGDGEADAAVVRMRLKFIDYMQSHYAITIEVERPDGKEETPIEYECQPCLDEELIDGARERVPEIMTRLQRSAAASGTEPGDGGGTDPGGGETEGERPRRGIMIAGYTAIGVGAGVLIGGVVTLTRPQQQVMGASTGVVDFKPLGIGLAVGGGAALAAGIVLVAVEATRCKRRGTCAASKETPSTSLVPMLDTTTAGVGILRHF